MRVAAAVLLLGVAAVLLVPEAPGPTRLVWDDLIAPLAVGQPITRGYVLAPPRRGDGEVVYVARRPSGPDGPATRIELHILDRGRWAGISETPRFGIGWEVPPAGAPYAASEDDARAVTKMLAAAVARNDPGDRSVDAIALANEPDPPQIVRVLASLSGMRGPVIGLAVALALVLLSEVRGGTVAIGIMLFAAGLALRATALNVPFVHDQDVQRLLTGNLSLHEIATGKGLEDRHPPLYFFVLHAVQRIGQSEAIGRAPAVVAGALIGPAILLASGWMRGPRQATASLAALAVTVSPELVTRSREVSEIPLFALMVIAASASLVAAAAEPQLGRLIAVACAHALALCTYYVAPFLVAVHGLLLAWWRPAARVLVAFTIGVLAGLPAIALAALRLQSDASARSTAHRFPFLAWGEHSPGQMLIDIGRIAVAAFGLPFLTLAMGAIVVGAARGNRPVITAAAGAAAVIVGIAAFSPLARVQPYYASTILPLVGLVVAVTPHPTRPAVRTAWLTAVLLAVAGWTVPSLATVRDLYIPDADAFMPRFAATIAQRPEATVVVVAHYDKTLLVYYLARADDRDLNWDTWEPAGGKRIEPLLMVHELTPGFEADAARRLNEIIASGPTLVIDRDAVTVPAIAARLASCEQLLDAPSARLLCCTP